MHGQRLTITNMKKFTSLLIGCSLALVGAAMAQQPEEQVTPTKKSAAQQTQATEATTAKPEETAARHQGAKAERRAAKSLKAEATPTTGASAGTEANVSDQGVNAKGRGKKGKNAAATETNVSGSPAASATPNAMQGRKGKNARGANAKASASPVTAATASATPATAASASATPVAAASASASPVTAASASPASSVGAAGAQNAQVNTGAKMKRPDPQVVQQIKQQHTNFRAEARPQQIPAVTFNPGYRIQGSDQWSGPQYEVFRSYHPERHDQGWYRSHYNRVELIGGGYYYWNNGYWYPAWGYNQSNEYYAYDGPIYVGHRAEPPDQVIANVQATLQAMGYYKGEVDGLLGPLTREALTGYQTDNGLIRTAVIDEPTLDSLGMG
jgi:hypothetical protein